MIPIIHWSSADPVTKRRILGRSQSQLDEIYPRIREWIQRIRSDGDRALVEYVREFDDPDFVLSSVRVGREEIVRAYERVPEATLGAIRSQVDLCQSFQRAMADPRPLVLREMLPGVLAGKKISPLQSAGIYVPAGSAPLPSVMQVLAVPAKIAGVSRIVACLPPRGRVPEMLVTADIAGVDEIYCVGGVAAIAALAYGTESIRPVDKIVGPGSIYVQAAKALVRDDVAIDMLAGPSEVLVLADEEASPAYIAADLLAQCEHDPNAASVLVTWSSALAADVQGELRRQMQSLSRQAILRESLQRYSGIVLVDDARAAVTFAEEYSPEHIELLVRDPWVLLPQIRSAGSIFLGQYAPVPVGDYATGTNNTLPTGKGNRAYSPISVRTFQKESEVQYLTKDGLGSLRDIVERMSDVEGLDAHKRAVQIRFDSPSPA